MRVIFKDVGQGDSIIIEWTGNDGNSKLGIIDCNLKGHKLNPVLNHIKAIDNLTEIEFIILSHPHKDHYSGMEQLLDYIKEKKIRVHKFAHTLRDQGSLYWWRWFEKDTEDVRLLVRIMRLVRELKKELKIITSVQALTENVRIDLANEIYLKCLSPSNDEAEEYQRLVKTDPDKNTSQASAAANYLSTVFKLNVRGKCVLFTSDAEIFSFNRIIDHFPDVKEKIFFLCQLPHHGAKKNHCIPFWTWLKMDEKCKEAIVSSGQQDQYHHPDYDTVKWFSDNGFVIKATNIVYGMKELKKALTKKNLLMDGISSFAPESFVRGDQTFTF